MLKRGSTILSIWSGINFLLAALIMPQRPDVGKPKPHRLFLDIAYSVVAAFSFAVSCDILLGNACSFISRKNLQSL